jgi:hypothetical protein
MTARRNPPRLVLGEWLGRRLAVISLLIHEAAAHYNRQDDLTAH